MKVFYVGDNRVQSNWGRGASIALAELLSSAFDINGRITAELFSLSRARVGYVNTILPPSRYNLFRYILNHQGRRTYRAYLKLERMFGAKDFLSEDPAESVNNIIAHKARHAELARIYDECAAADVVVIDGDGDIIWTTPPRREVLFFLAMIELSARLGKPVFLVNSMISDCPLTGRNQRTCATARAMFAKCRGVALRDPESVAFVKKEMPEIEAAYIPDSLFAWFPLYANETSRPPANGNFLLPFPEKAEYWGRLDFSKPYIAIGGGALSSGEPRKSIESYTRLVNAVKGLGLPVYLTINDSPDSFLEEVAVATGVGVVPVDAPILACGAVLAHARLFLSGRYHPSIFASLGGTPCIFLKSHAHKMGSLPKVLEYEDSRQFNAFPTDAEIAEIISHARFYLKQGEGLRTKIKNAAEKCYQQASSLPNFITERISAVAENRETARQAAGR